MLCAEDVWIVESSNNKIPGNWNIAKTNIWAVDLPPMFIVFLHVFLFPAGKRCFTNCNSNNDCSGEALQQRCWTSPVVCAILNLTFGKSVSYSNINERLAYWFISWRLDLANSSYLCEELQEAVPLIVLSTRWKSQEFNPAYTCNFPGSELVLFT